MKYKRLKFKTDEFDEEQGIFEGYASVFGVLDSDGDIVDQGAFARTISEGEAAAGVPLLAQHDDHALPLGKSLELSEDARGLKIRGYISPTRDGRDYRQLIKDGVITDMSIGYVEVDQETDRDGIRHLKDVELLEISLVTFPANREASITSYKGERKTMSKKNVSELSVEELQEMVADTVMGTMVELEKRKNDDPDEEKTDNSEDEEKTAEDEEKTSDSDEEDKNEDEDEKGRSKGTHSIRDMVQRKYADIFVPRPTKTDTSDKLPKGIGWARYIKCMHRAGGDYDHAASIAKKSYQDAKLEREIKALSVTSPSGGGFLVPEIYAAEIIPMLNAKSIIMALGATTIPMENGNITIPKHTGSASAYYVGELRKPEKSAPSFGNIKMSGKKLMTNVVISNDLLRSNSYQADQIVLNDATQRMALERDIAAFSGTGTEFSPKGLLNMGIKVLPIGKVDEKTSGSMRAQLIRNNADVSRLGWAINGFAWEVFYNLTNAMGLYVYRDQMDKDQISGYPYKLGDKQLPTNNDAKGTTKIVLGNWSEFLVGEQVGMEAKMMEEATVKQGDGSIVSVADIDATMLRILSIHDFAVRHEESFVIGAIETK